MERTLAYDLIDRYVASWLATDVAGFLSCLHPQAVVREHTGAVYAGVSELERWFRDWNRNGNRVLLWELLGRGCDEAEERALVEWEFACRFEGTEYRWLGVSTVRFSGSLIAEVNEYERKYPR